MGKLEYDLVLIRIAATACARDQNKKPNKPRITQQPQATTIPICHTQKKRGDKLKTRSLLMRVEAPKLASNQETHCTVDISFPPYVKRNRSQHKTNTGGGSVTNSFTHYVGKVREDR